MKAESSIKNWLIGAVMWGALASAPLKADQHNEPPEGECIVNGSQGACSVSDSQGAYSEAMIGWVK